ncbi:hypothetical protein BHM03_00007833 [Ensete ventricosum]|nr:hypothetical protein BHM03_00007833 [Ensete ventricosum]
MPFTLSLASFLNGAVWTSYAFLPFDINLVPSSYKTHPARESKERTKSKEEEGESEGTEKKDETTPTFKNIIKRKAAEQYLPIPELARLLKCMLGVLYGLPIVHPNSRLVLTSNAIGLFLQAVYLTIYLIYAAREIRVAHTHEMRSLIVGIPFVVFGSCMYAAPIAFLIPNGLGVLFDLAQLILYACYCKSTSKAEERAYGIVIGLQQGFLVNSSMERMLGTSGIFLALYMDAPLASSSGGICCTSGGEVGSVACSDTEVLTGIEEADAGRPPLTFDRPHIRLMLTISTKSIISRDDQVTKYRNKALTRTERSWTEACFDEPFFG